MNISHTEHAHGLFTVGETAIFEVPPDHRFARHNGLPVVIRHGMRNWSVGHDDDDPHARDDVGYAVSCASWDASDVHEQGWYFCSEEWLKKANWQ